MTVAPRYNFPAGSGIVLPGRSLVVVRSGPDGVEAIEEHDGSAHFLPYLQLVTELKLPGVRIDAGRSTHGNRLRHRLGGFETSQALKEEQRAVGRFNHALCLGMIALRDELRREHGKPHLRLGRTKLATQENRKFICQVAQAYFNQRIYTDRPPGGRKKAWIMYGGTTLAHYLNVFDNLQEGEDPLDALTPLDHLRGNRKPRIGYRLLELMTRAWEEIGLDKRKRSVANVRKRLETLIDEENKVRSRNGLKDLILPSDKTIKAHRNRLLKPTEYLIAVSGETYARNKRGRGSTDVRALMIGEYVEIDECKLSIVTCFREAGIWDKLSKDQKAAAEDLDKEIAARLVLIVIIDVASRMPLAWVLSDQPRAVATLEALRMATRDKIREREMYGCLGEPARGVGIGHIKSDNGTGLRNAVVKQAELGIGAISTDARIYSATDKPYVERLLGTEETGVLQLLHGYTGRKAGHLTDYDAQTAGVLDTGMLYGIISRFMIDVYPSERHYGFGMGGRRPIEVYKEIMETRGSVPPIDPHLRRIHLGWQDEVTLNDEGVRVFSGIWFNSDELQKHETWHRQKVQVFVDPDDLNFATVLVPGVRTPVEVALQATVFADLSLPEALEVMAAWRREHPEVTEVHQDRLMRHRRELFESQRKIGIAHKLPRSYSTIEECRRRAKAVFAGARIMPVADRVRTVAPDSLADLGPDVPALKIGSGGGLIDGTAEDVTAGDATFEPSALVPESSSGSEPVEAGGPPSPADAPAPAPTSKPSTDPLPKPTVRKLQ